MEKVVYLAGPILGQTYEEATEWRDYAKMEFEKHGIITTSPMRAKDFAKKYKTMLDEAKENPLGTKKGIVTRDRYDVQNCNIMLVNLKGAKRISIGTMIEYGWADILRKPIITIMEEENVHNHAFIKEISGFIVEDLDSGISLVKKILLP